MCYKFPIGLMLYLYTYLDRLKLPLGNGGGGGLEDTFSPPSSITSLTLPDTANGSLMSFSFKFSTLLAKSSIDCFLGDGVAVLLLLIDRRSIPACAKFKDTSEWEKSGGAIRF